jgi:hypothetical protein
MDYYNGSVPGTRLSESQKARLGNWKTADKKPNIYEVAQARAREQKILEENEKLKQELAKK